jgi:hypothetical protein
VAACFCTLAIHAPYRRRARLLCADTAPAPWVVLTDDPADFADLPVRAVRHQPTGPMASDYLQRLCATGNHQGAAAYHDKRFAVRAALEAFDTAIFLDADSRVAHPFDLEAAMPAPPPGLAVVPVVRRSVAAHLETCGSWRLAAFAALARELTGDVRLLETAPWCHETCYAVTRTGGEDRFFDAWAFGATFLQRHGVFSGEGGVMGIAAASAGWATDYDALAGLASFVRHEGGGPKDA